MEASSHKTYFKKSGIEGQYDWCSKHDRLKVSVVFDEWWHFMVNKYTRAEAMLATLIILREQFGGPENYMLEKCGLTKEEAKRIRSNLIVETPAIYQKFQHSL